MSDTTRSNQSTGRSRRNAASVPSPIPMTMPMAMAVPASSRVAGTYSARSVRTARWLCWESPRSPWTTLPRYVKYCTGSGLSRPYRWLNEATASGSAMARWPRLAAAGSPGTTFVSTNVTSVMPSNSSSAATRRRPTKRPIRADAIATSDDDRALGHHRSSQGSRGSEPADVERERRVELRARDPVGHRHHRGFRLEQRKERARFVELLLELLVQRPPLGVVDARGRLLSDRLDVGGVALGPAGAQTDELPGAERQVVLRVRVVRVPQPQTHLLLAGAIVLERGRRRAGHQFDLNTHLVEVGLDALGEWPEREPVRRQVARV